MMKRKRVELQKPSSKKTVHLHWCWRAGPKMLKGLLEGYSTCGEAFVPRANLTVFPDDATCQRCLILSGKPTVIERKRVRVRVELKP